MSSSGYFDTIIYNNALPLSTNQTPYSTLTMFAVGPSNTLQGYSFYQYQRACGFQDTSTITNQLGNSVQSTFSVKILDIESNISSFTSTLTSSIQGTNLNLLVTSNSLISTINFVGKTYTSTIPYVRWISSDTVTSYPFYYNSSFTSSYISTFFSTILPYTSSFVSTAISSITINNYPFIFNSSFISSFTSSFLSSILPFTSTLTSTLVSSVLVTTYPFIFNSSFVSSINYTTQSTILPFTSSLTSNQVSSVLVTTYPFSYISSFTSNYNSTIISTIQPFISSIPSSFVSSITVNTYPFIFISSIYDPPFISTITVVTYPFYFNSSVVSSYASSINLPLVSSFNSNFLSTSLTTYTINTYPFYFNSSFNVAYTSSIGTTFLVYTSTLQSTLNSTFTITQYPFYFNSSFLSSYTSSIPLTLTTSTLNFISSLISSIAVTTFPYYFNSSLISTYTSSISESILSTPINTLSNFTSSGVLANSQLIDFVSTGLNQVYPGNIITPNLWLGDGITRYINTGNYRVYLDFHYSLYLSTSFDNFTWINTLGSLNTLDNPLFTFGNKGSSSSSRVGNTIHTQINSRLLFNPRTQQIPANVSNFQLQLILNSTVNAISSLSPYFDIYIPSSNNFKITLYPLV